MLGLLCMKQPEICLIHCYFLFVSAVSAAPVKSFDHTLKQNGETQVLTKLSFSYSCRNTSVCNLTSALHSNKNLCMFIPRHFYPFHLCFKRIWQCQLHKPDKHKPECWSQIHTSLMNFFFFFYFKKLTEM